LIRSGVNSENMKGISVTVWEVVALEDVKL
jgi:hypothetical protein